MGHYNEPKLAIDHVFLDEKPYIYGIQYNPLTGIWKIENPISEIPKASLDPIKLTVGNTHSIYSTTHNDSNRHKWEMFVKSDEVNLKDHVSSVTYHLHPTFEPSKITLTDPPYHIERIGWGTFVTGVDLNLNTGKVVTLKHNLQFNNNQQTYIINQA